MINLKHRRRDQIREANRRWRAKNKEKVYAYHKKWRLKNKEKWNQYYRDYNKDYRKRKKIIEDYKEAIK